MRFAVIDAQGNVLRSWDSGKALRERLLRVISHSMRFLPLRPKMRRKIEAAIDDALADMIHQFGLDVSKAHQPTQ